MILVNEVQKQNLGLKKILMNTDFKLAVRHEDNNLARNS